MTIVFNEVETLPVQPGESQRGVTGDNGRQSGSGTGASADLAKLEFEMVRARERLARLWTD